MSKEIIIEEDTKTETKEMILDLPEGERGITEEETEKLCKQYDIDINETKRRWIQSWT